MQTVTVLFILITDKFKSYVTDVEDERYGKRIGQLYLFLNVSGWWYILKWTRIRFCVFGFRHIRWSSVGWESTDRTRSRTSTQSDNRAINLRRRARCLSYGHYLPASNRTLKLFVAGRTGADFTLL